MMEENEQPLMMHRP